MATIAESLTAQDPLHFRHHIAPDHDFLLITKQHRILAGPDGQQRIVHVHEFEVTKAALVSFDYFRVALTSTSFADTGKDSYEVREDDPAALKIWMQLLHDSLDDTSFTVSNDTVWHVLVIARKYDFDVLGKEAKGWFQQWYKAHGDSLSLTDCRELLYPCYSFDEAHGFAAVTERLVYDFAGHIEERRPDGVSASLKEHRIGNNRVIGSLNGARGSLRTRLISNLYDPSRSLLNKSDCKQKEEVFWCYNKALQRTGAWPVEIEGSRKSISQLLKCLDKFKYKDPHPDAACESYNVCKRNFEDAVEAAVAHCRDQFDGLCLDCMNCSANADEDEEYWTHASRRSFSSGCRIDHGQPTWYFSFLGRREKMDLFQRKDKPKSRGY